MNFKVFVKAGIIEQYILLFWKTPADMNFKDFVEAIIYEPIIMLVPLKHFNNSFSQQSIWFVEESSFKVEVIE